LAQALGFFAMRALALRALQRPSGVNRAVAAVSVRFVNTSVKRSEKADSREHVETSFHGQDDAKQAMKSNKGEMAVYDFYSLAKVFQGTAKRQGS